MLFIQYPSWISPEIVPFLPVRWYGLMYLVAFSTCFLFVRFLARKEKDLKVEQQLSSVFIWAFVGMILGARLVSELVYSQNISILIKPWLLIWPFQNGRFTGIQGMSYHGGLVGIIIAVYLACKIKRIPFAEFADKGVIGAALGYTFGRLGNFFNGELYGRITTVPWGMVFPHAELLPVADPRVNRVAEILNIDASQLGLVNLPRHPSQLYEALLEGVVTGLILYMIYYFTKIRSPKKYVPGVFISLYIICYGIARFIVEYFRQPDSGLDFVIKFSNQPNPNWLFVSPFNFTTGQVFSGIMILVGIIILTLQLIVHYRRSKQNRIVVSV